MAAIPRPPITIDPPDYLAIEIEGIEDHPPLQETAGFIFDLNLIYEIARVATDPTYERYKFSHYIWTRRWKPLKDADRLHVTSLQLGSPFLLETGIGLGIGAIGAVYAIIEAVEKIADWKANREIKKLELEKLRRELYPLHESVHQSENMTPRLEQRGALEYYERSVERLSKNQIKITDMRLRLESKPHKGH